MSAHRPMPPINPKTYQNGMVLLLCLIFLTAMMLVGLSASADTILQNKLSANLRETERARQAAHAAMLWAERWVLKLDLPALVNCSNTCDFEYFQTTGSLPAKPESEPLSWWLEKGFETGSEPQNTVPGTSPDNFWGDQSLWLVEPVHMVTASEDGAIGARVWFRVLSRGTNDPETVVSVIESIIVRTWPTGPQVDSTNINPAEWCAARTDACGRVSWRKLR